MFVNSQLQIMSTVHTVSTGCVQCTTHYRCVLVVHVYAFRLCMIIHTYTHAYTHTCMHAYTHTHACMHSIHDHGTNTSAYVSVFILRTRYIVCALGHRDNEHNETHSQVPSLSLSFAFMFLKCLETYPLPAPSAFRYVEILCPAAQKVLCQLQGSS